MYVNIKRFKFYEQMFSFHTNTQILCGWKTSLNISEYPTEQN